MTTPVEPDGSGRFGCAIHSLLRDGSEADSPTLGPGQPSLESRLGQARTDTGRRKASLHLRRQGDTEPSVRTLRERGLQILVSVAEGNTSGDTLAPPPVLAAKRVVAGECGADTRACTRR